MRQAEDLALQDLLQRVRSGTLTADDVATLENGLANRETPQNRPSYDSISYAKKPNLYISKHSPKKEVGKPISFLPDTMHLQA
jgi:hypothetical protein